MRPITAGLMLAASVLALEPVAAADETFDQRLKEATQNRGSEAGRKYDEAFSKEFGAQYAPRLSRCLKQTGDPAPDTDFQMLLKLAGDGQVERAMVRPETKMAACFRDLTKPTKYPAPTSAGYWYVVDMHFSKK
jgi:hypothetical protein